MELVEFISELKHLDFQQKRYHADRLGEYAQLVLRDQEEDHCRRLIKKLLGPPVKKAGAPVTDELVYLTKDLGEIFDHQTLFVKEENGYRIIAMLWPWQTSPFVTLEIAISKMPEI